MKDRPKRIAEHRAELSKRNIGRLYMMVLLAIHIYSSMNCLYGLSFRGYLTHLLPIASIPNVMALYIGMKYTTRMLKI